MRGKKHILRPGYFLILFLLVLGSGIWIPRLKYMSETGRLTEDILFTADFRRQPVTEELLKEIKNVDQPGEMLGIYWLETDFGRTEKAFSKMDRSRWTVRPGWSEFAAACRAVWDDAVYFPVAEAANRTDAKVTFEDSWMFGRSYKGDRGHEGTDIMASVNERGLYPVVSMTDGTVRSKGWLELGGWRLGIETEQGAYFYYAHLDSYAQIEEGDAVKAGDLLGYMGDTGYSTVEGTTGNFPVHLHLGIYLYPGGREISVDPYGVLKYVEDRRISWIFR